MRLNNDYSSDSVTLINDLIYNYFDSTLDKEKIVENTRKAIRLISRSYGENGYLVSSKVYSVLKKLSFEDMKDQYNKLKKSNYLPQIIKIKETNNEVLTLFEIIKTYPKFKEIYLKSNKRKYITLYKIGFFEFENEYYVVLKDDKSNTDYYRYSKSVVDDHDKENLFQIKDNVLINIFNELGFNK